MLFGVRPEGVSDSAQAIEAIHASMVVVLRVLGEVTARAGQGTGQPGRLDPFRRTAFSAGPGSACG
jgi:hypothetical protein